MSQLGRAMATWITRYRMLIASIALSIAALPGVVVIAFGNIAAAKAWARGRPLAVITPLPLRVADTNCEVVLRVANYSRQPVRLIGSLAQCGGGIDVRESMPIAIAAGKAVDLHIDVDRNFGGCQGGDKEKSPNAESAPRMVERTSHLWIYSDCRETSSLEIPVVLTSLPSKS